MVSNAIPRWCVLLCFSLVVGVFGETFSTDINALNVFYNSTSGTDWNWQGSGIPWVFNSDADPCLDNWQGIGCAGCSTTTTSSSSVCTVTEIVLIDYNLTGTLPTALCELVNLTVFSVGSNFLSSTIPSCIFN